MTKEQLTTQLFNLGGFTVNPQEHTLCITLEDGQSKTHQLPTKCIEVLCYMVVRYPQVISRQELIDTIWQGNISVGQKSLTNAIWSLRKILNQNPAQIQAITTIRKSGYKLELTPEFLPLEQPSTPPLTQPSAQLSNEDNSRPLIPPKKNLDSLTEKIKKLSTKLRKKFVFVSVIVFVLIYSFFDQFVNKNRQLINMPSIALPIETISSHPGRELYPNTSKDGRWLTFIWYRVDLTSELHLVDLTNQQPTQVLALSNHRDLKPTWHPNNQHIFMIRKDNNNKTCEIVKVDRISKTLKHVTPCSHKSHGFLTFDNQGKNLLYTFEDPKTKAPGRYQLTLDHNAEPSAAPKRLSCLHECDYQDRDIAYSPDGLWAAQVRKYTPHTEDLYIINQQTNQLKRLTHDFQQLRGIQWSKDSRYLILSAQSHGQRQGLILDSISGKSKTINIDGFSYPHIDHHSNSIYYHEWQQNKFISRLLVDTEPKSVYPLLQAKHDFTQPHYSEIVNKITFVSTESGYSEIWIADADGNNRQQLTHNQQIVKFPRWSFDGKHIAFLAPQLGNDQNLLQVLNVTDKQITTVQSQYRNHTRPVWHINNQALIATIEDDHSHSLKRFDIFNIKAKQHASEILPQTLYAQMLKNGDIIYAKHEQGIWLKQGRLEQQLLEQKQIGSSFNWTHHNGKLYFEQASNKQQQLAVLDINTGQIEPLASFAKRTIDIYGTSTFIPGRNELLLSKQQFPQVDIKRVGIEY